MWIAVFLMWLWPIQIPLPHLALSLLLSQHAPSVYMSIVLGLRANPWTWCHLAGMCDVLSGSVKVRRHSSRLSLQVIEGSKIISLSSSLACQFLSFLRLVGESLSCSFPISRGLYLGAMARIWWIASCVHVWGLVHLLFLSWEH